MNIGLSRTIVESVELFAKMQIDVTGKPRPYNLLVTTPSDNFLGTLEEANYQKGYIILRGSYEHGQLTWIDIASITAIAYSPTTAL